MKLVNIKDFGLKGENYYWKRKELYRITELELAEIGVNSGDMYVDESIIQPLLNANSQLNKSGYYLFVADGYRSNQMYELVYKKRVKATHLNADPGAINLIDKPHSKGTVVDIALYDLETNKEIYLRDKQDDPEAYYVDFYSNKTDEKSKEFCRLQQLLKSVMYSNGFVYGVKNEYWHFDYKG